MALADQVPSQRIFEDPAFALVPPGAPRGEFPVSLQDRDDGPHSEPHYSFALVDGVYASEALARAAVRKGIPSEGGEFRRLLVRLQFYKASVVDARSEITAMALRRGDGAQLNALRELYDRGIDIVRVRGPEGELDLIFTDAIGDRVHIVDEVIVTERAGPRPRVRLTDVLLAIGAALAVELIKAAVQPLIHLSIPLWIPVVAFLAIAVLRPAVAIAKVRLRQTIEASLVRAIEQAAHGFDEQAPPALQQRHDQDPKQEPGDEGVRLSH